MPGSGDTIQALKAGVMEIPDVIAINKRNHPAAKTLLQELRSTLVLERDGWTIPIVLTEAVEGAGIEELWSAVEAHRAFLEECGELERRAARAARRGGVRARLRAGEDAPRAGGRRRRGAGAAAWPRSRSGGSIR